MNKSDIMHYFIAGSAIEYFIIDPNASNIEVKKVILGPNIANN